jgi:hypothetical protein
MLIYGLDYLLYSLQGIIIYLKLNSCYVGNWFLLYLKTNTFNQCLKSPLELRQSLQTQNLLLHLYKLSLRFKRFIRRL